MKVILTGCTGFVGNEVLTQCLQNPSITSVVVLTRRELPSTITNPKLTVRILDDFTLYPDSLLEDLKGAGACIWTLGKAMMTDMELARRIHIDYPMAAARAFDKVLSPSLPSGKKFRFIYCSGELAERDQQKSLWMAPEYRRIRGAIENELISYAETHAISFESYILRPGFIVPTDAYVKAMVLGMWSAIKVDQLSRKMIEIALNGDKLQILDNSAMSS